MKNIRSTALAVVTCLMAASASACPVDVQPYGEGARTGTHTSVTIAFPDVCKTPTPGRLIPIPYPNLRMADPLDPEKQRTGRIRIHEGIPKWTAPGLEHTPRDLEPVVGPYPAWHEGDGLYHTMPVGEPELIDPEAIR